MLALKVALSAFILFWFAWYVLGQVKPILPERHISTVLIAGVGVCSLFTFAGALIWAVFSLDC